MKAVVITGSTKGIGLGLAREFLIRDCSVVISSRSRPKLEQVVAELRKEFGADRVAGQPCDVTDSGQVQALWDAAVKSYGRVDVWINNAGIANTMLSLLELDLAEVAPVIDTNVTGLIYGAMIAFRGMTKQGSGQIYNMYGHGFNDNKVSGLHIYGTTKRAVRYFSEALIQDAEGSPVQVGIIGPGIVVTDFLIDDMRKMSPDQLEMVKPIYNCMADTVETVTPFLAEGIFNNDQNGAEIHWLTEEKINERMNSDEYCSRDLFSSYGL